MELVKSKKKKRHWTQEEEELLSELWGRISLRGICLKLNRSEMAIRLKVNRLGLGSFLSNCDNPTLNSVLVAVFGYTSGDVKERWISKGLSVRYKKVYNETFCTVSISEFWRFAKVNRTLIPWDRFPVGALGKEPAWVDAQRKQDVVERFREDRWTKFEDDRLRKYLSEFKYSYKDLRLLLNRSEGAIRRRVQCLGLTARPLAPESYFNWSKAEIDILGNMIKNGAGYTAIADALNTSVCSVRGKVYNTYKSDRLDVVRELIGDGNFFDNMPPVAARKVGRAPRSKDCNATLVGLVNVLERVLAEKQRKEDCFEKELKAV